MTTLATVARNENFVHLTVTPSPVPFPDEDLFRNRRFYRWDVVMQLKGEAPDLAAYTTLIDHISLGYVNPSLWGMPLAEDTGVEVADGMWAESIYIEDKDETPCPSYVEDGSCIHSEHTR